MDTSAILVVLVTTLTFLQNADQAVSQAVPPGCPQPSSFPGPCVFDPSINCLSDQECTITGQLCCPEGCNRICKQPIDITPCALILCAAGQICVERQVQCVRAPCPPVGECVPDVCEEGRPAVDSSGNFINCGRGGSTCPRDYECIIDPTDRYALCCRETDDDDDTNVGLIIGVVGGVVALIIIIIIIICCCCCCGCCGAISGNQGDGYQGNMMQCGGGCCYGPPPPRHQTIKVMGNHQPAHYPVPSPVQYPGQQVQIVQVPGIHNAVAPMGISSAVAPMGFRKLNCQY